MKRAFTLIWFSIAVSLAKPQSGFNNIYSGGTSFKFNLTEMPDQKVIVGLGRTRAISHLDIVGNVTYTHSFWAHPTAGMTGLGAIRAYADNEYVFVAGYHGGECDVPGASGLIFHPAIVKMDAFGTLLDLRHYVLDLGCRNTIGDLVVTTDRGMVAWGYEKSFLAMKVDSLLNPVWARRFPNNGGFQFIKELPGGDLLAGINMDTAGAVVARMDPDGNFLWCKSYIRPRGMVHDAVIESDNSFIITGYTDSTASTNPFVPYPPTYHPKLFMMKLNGEGDVQWCKGYDSAPNLWYSRNPSCIERTSDGNYAVLATLGYPDNNFFFRPYLMKVDLNGDTLWTRAVGASGFDYYTQDLLIHSDGGFMISGGVWGDLPEAQSGLPYIFKTDTLGHFPCSERHHPVQVMDLFPTDSSFILTSVDGFTMYPALLNDTTFAPINVYDACVVATALPFYGHMDRRPSIRPNPNTGRFTVEFPDPLMAESYYSVYDAMGRLLLQRRLPAGSTTEQVDLSRYGTGTYVIKFTSPEGVQHERVVVE